MDKNKIIICRCEDITLQQIHDALDQGYTTFEDLKRILRLGMGPCQANTCGHLVQREISQYLHIPIEEVAIQKVRPLTTGVPLDAIAKEQNHER